MEPEIKRWLLAIFEDCDHQLAPDTPDQDIFVDGAPSVSSLIMTCYRIGVALSRLLSHLSGDKIKVKKKAGLCSLLYQHNS